MTNAERLLHALDAKLNAFVELTLYGAPLCSLFRKSGGRIVSVAANDFFSAAKGGAITFLRSGGLFL
jgi:hypothetical protein